MAERTPSPPVYYGGPPLSAAVSPQAEGWRARLSESIGNAGRAADQTLSYYLGPHATGAVRKLSDAVQFLSPASDMIDARDNYQGAIESARSGDVPGAVAQTGYGLLSNIGLSEVSKPVAAMASAVSNRDVLAKLAERKAASARAPLTDNYRKPLDTYAPSVWREMAPDEALAEFPGSSVSVSHGPGGPPERFYADTPDLALGQGMNRGVRIEYDPAMLEGVVNTAKPTWQQSWQSGMAEYKATPKAGADLRRGVRSIQIEKDAIPRGADGVLLRRQIEALKNAGWEVSETKGRFELKRPSTK